MEDQLAERESKERPTWHSEASTPFLFVSEGLFFLSCILSCFGACRGEKQDVINNTNKNKTSIGDILQQAENDNVLKGQMFEFLQVRNVTFLPEKCTLELVVFLMFRT